MSGMNVDGLISGLGTSDLISSLMQVEALPQAKLVASVAKFGKVAAAYRELNTRFDAIGKAAEVLGKAETWNSTKATTSQTSFATATVGAGAQPMSLTFSVKALAKAHTTVSERAVALEDVVATQPIQITVGGIAQDPIDVGDGTLSTVIANINKADAGVRAAAVQVSPGQYRLQLTASDTGIVGTYTVSPVGLEVFQGDGVGGVFDVVATGSDAELLMGGPGGYSIVNSSNTFADVLPGVSINALQADESKPITLKVTPDSAGQTAQVKAMVDAVNNALSHIAANSIYNVEAKTGGPLVGDSLARNLQAKIFSTMRELPSGSTLSSVGISIERNGTLSFDEAAFGEALAADPEGVSNLFTGAATVADEADGLAAKFGALVKLASDGSTGLITQAIQGKENLSRNFTGQIEEWDLRLEKRESILRRQFTAMEVALSNLRNQSTWLAGQVSGLSANNG